MALRRTLLDLHRQSNKLSLINNASRFQQLSSVPFSLTQKPKPELTGQSDLVRFSRLQTIRGYSNASPLPKLHALYHIGEGMEEILADYVHQEMTRNLMVVSLGLFQFIVIKDVFLFLFF